MITHTGANYKERQNWQEATIGGVFEFSYGKSLPEKNRISSGPYPVYGSSGIIGYHTNALVEDPTVIVGRKGNVGSIYINTKGCWPIDTTYFVKIPNNINAKFAYYLFRSLRLESLDKSTAIPGLNRNDVYKVPFLLPPFDLQRRIVEKIESLFSEIDQGVAALKKAQQQLGVYRQAVLKHAFEGKLTAEWREEHAEKLESPEELLKRIRHERKLEHQKQVAAWEQEVADWKRSGEVGKKPRKPSKPSQESEIPESKNPLPLIPDSWVRIKLGELLSSIEAGKSFRCEERPPTMSEVGVAKVSSVSWGEYDESESKTCMDDSLINEALFIREGDFLLSRANTIELVGACVIATEVSRNIMLSDKTLRISFSGTDPVYALHFLRSPWGRKEIIDRATGNQESMRNIGQERIRDIIIPMCSPEEAEVLVSKLSAQMLAISEVASLLDSEVARSESLRQSILQHAFSGRLIG